MTSNLWSELEKRSPERDGAAGDDPDGVVQADGDSAVPPVGVAVGEPVARGDGADDQCGDEGAEAQGGGDAIIVKGRVIGTRQELVAYYESQVQRTDGCWLWRGHRGNQHRMADRVKVYAHRLAYALFVGPLPDDLCVCHKCDNPPCVNPAHLFIGTIADNIQDMWAKGRDRSAVPNCQDHGRAILTNEDVTEIRRLLSVKSYKELAAMYGTSKAAIASISRGINWKHLPWPEGAASRSGRVNAGAGCVGTIDGKKVR
jgi:hypothetical protein